MTNNETIKAELLNRLDEHKTLLTAWRKVRRVKTKKGENFKIFSKNFTNCKIEPNFIGEMTIKVWGRSEKTSRYFDDNFSLKSRDFKRFNPSEDRIIKETCYTPFFELNLDEIEIVVQDTICYHEKRIQEINNQLKQVDIAVSEVKEELKKLVEITNKYDDDIKYQLYKMIREF